MKQNHTICSIAKTLYPLCQEDLTSPASNDFLNAHLQECPHCRGILQISSNASLAVGNASETSANICHLPGSTKADRRAANNIRLSEASYLKHYRRLFFASTLGVFFGILLFAMLFTNMAFGMNRFFKLLTRQHTVHTDSVLDYHQWEDYKGISDFAVFPEDLSICKSVNKYYYQCSSSSILTELQLYLDCSYTPSAYEMEKQRLSKTARTDGEPKLFAQSACCTMLFCDTACEYAIFLEEEHRILYISLENISRDEIVFDEDYLPLDYGNFGSPPENQAAPYCMYPDNIH